MKSRVSNSATHIGYNLKQIRRKKGLSQKSLAGILEISFQQLQKYENGINRIPVEHIYSLKNYFDVPYDHFFETGCAPSIPQSPDNQKKMEKIISLLEGVQNDIKLGQIHEVIRILVKK